MYMTLYSFILNYF